MGHHEHSRRRRSRRSRRKTVRPADYDPRIAKVRHARQSDEHRDSDDHKASMSRLPVRPAGRSRAESIAKLHKWKHRHSRPSLRHHIVDMPPHLIPQNHNNKSSLWMFIIGAIALVVIVSIIGYVVVKGMDTSGKNHGRKNTKEKVTVDRDNHSTCTSTGTSTDKDTIVTRSISK